MSSTADRENSQSSDRIHAILGWSTRLTSNELQRTRHWNSRGVMCYDANDNLFDGKIQDVVRIEFRRDWAPWIMSTAPTIFTQRGRARKQLPMMMEDWQVLGVIMSECTGLKSLDFKNGKLYYTNVAALFGERQYLCPLASLDFEGNTLGFEGLSAMTQFLQSQEEILYLDLSKSDVSNSGAKLLSDSLNHVRIKDLHLRNTNISGVGVKSLLSPPNAKHLQNLELKGNFVGRQGVEAICKLLEQDDAELQNFSLGDVDIKWVKMLFSSISKNITLQCFQVGHVSMNGRNGQYLDATIDKEIKATWTNMVLNISSFDAFCASNHTFQNFTYTVHMRCEDDMTYSRLLQEVLLIHSRRRLTKQQKLKRKLRLLCSKDTQDLALLFSMELIYVPHMLKLLATSLVSGNEGSLDDVYRFIRNWDARHIFSQPSSVAETKI